MGFHQKDHERSSNRSCRIYEQDKKTKRMMNSMQRLKNFQNKIRLDINSCNDALKKQH